MFDFSLNIKKFRNKIAKYNLIAFLDCGVFLKKNWLINQYLFLKKHKLDCVFGKCLFKPIDNFNVSVILNTYGYKSTHEVIPSSLVSKRYSKKLVYLNLKELVMIGIG